MNVVKFEFFKNTAAIASAEYDSSEKIKFIFSDSGDGYLSIGPRLIKTKDGMAEVELYDFSDGTHGCYLCVGGKRYELPSLEKLGRLFRFSPIQSTADMARVCYLKELEGKVLDLEKRLSQAEEKIYGRRAIL